MNTESKPAKPGTYYGERQGKWIWTGTGLPTDQWVETAQPPVEKTGPPEVTPFAKPAVARWMILVMNPVDATYLIDSSSKGNYKHGHYLVMNSNDAFLQIT